MFDSLDDQMKHDVRAEKTSKERVLQYLVVAAICAVFLVGLYFGVRFLE